MLFRIKQRFEIHHSFIWSEITAEQLISSDCVIILYLNSSSDARIFLKKERNQEGGSIHEMNQCDESLIVLIKAYN